MMMVVDDMEIIPPRKMRLIMLRPRIYPTPANVIPVMTISAVITAEPPACISLRKENSRPIENMSTTMPRSAQNSMFSMLEIEGR